MSSKYKLVIVESPSKCKKIEQYLNAAAINASSYKCIASYGHIRELKGLDSINIHDNFSPKFINCDSKKEQISKIKKAIKDADEIILASDDDREGEAIAWHLCQVFKLPLETTKRIIFHEITEPALKHAIENPTKVNMSVVNAQLARQVLDIIVGYRLSPLLWKHVKDGLSAGRCQTPALRLIYENQKQIDTATEKQSYTITGYFTNMSIPFILNYEETDKEKMQLFLRESIDYTHLYKEPKLRTKTCVAPAPFSTSTLQQTASNELHLSPKETMSLCQSLYEGGYITYPRTDGKEYSDEFQEKAVAYIKKTYGETYVGGSQTNKVTTNAKPSTTAAHEAIRPTKIECDTIEDNALTTKAIRLYNLIRRRTLESCMSNASLSVLLAVITAPQNYEYHYTTEHIIFAGWKIVSIKNRTTNKEYSYLQTLKKNISLPYKKIKAIIRITETKQHYTEAKLVNLLEEKGIGRPSTFSSLVDKIQERKYVKKENIKGKTIKCDDIELEKGEINIVHTDKEFGNEKNKLVITPVGILALEFLLNHFDSFFQYDYTKQMEDDLDLVVNGEFVWYDVCRKYYNELDNLSSSILDRGKETIRIDDNHTYMIGKYGPVILYKGVNEQNKKDSAFKAVRKDIDLNKLRQGKYTIDEVLESAEDKKTPSIGLFHDKPIYIKVGKFGKYLEWNGNTKSLKHLKIDPNEITIEDVSELLFDSENDMEHTRVIGNDASIKKGKYGHYIYYKTKKMKKPRFLKLDGFTGGDYMKCELQVIKDWFVKTYQIELS